MGIIQRQSIKGVIVFVLGAAIHFCTMLWLMPSILSDADFAVYRVYFALITIFSILGAGGINAIIIRHVQDFNGDPMKLKVFNLLSLLSITFFALISVVLIYLCKDVLYAWKKTETPFLMTYFYCVPLCTFFFVLLSYFEAFSIATHRLTAPSIVKEIILRFILLLGVVLYYFHYISIFQFFLLYALSYFVALLIMMTYCILIRDYRIAYNKKVLHELNFKSYLPYAFSIFLVGIIGALILNIDQPVVYALLGSQATLIYGHAVTTAALITIPYKPLSAILLPFAFNAWQTKDMNKLNEINKQSSRYLSAIGALLFALLVANADNIIHIVPKFASFKWPLIIIGLGRVLDYTTGISSEIVLTSPSHKKLILYMSLTFLFSLLCYKLLIPPLHEIGAALSCSFTLVFFNILKFLHLRTRYNLQPITKESLLFITLGFITILIQFVLPQFDNFILDAFIRSTIVCIIYFSVAYFAKWLPDVNEYVNKFLPAKKSS